MAVAAEPKAKKTAATKKPKSSPSHPAFIEMIRDAIVTLKERTGSSQYAITKFIEEKHKQLPPNFRKLLLHYLKKSVSAGKLVKVKNSFKIPPIRSAPVKASAPAATKKPAKVVTKAVSKPRTVATNKIAASSAKTTAKRKETVKPKAKGTSKQAKVAKTSMKASPGKKIVKAAKKTSVKSMKKPKSVKSPVPARKAKK